MNDIGLVSRPSMVNWINVVTWAITRTMGWFVIQLYVRNRKCAIQNYVGMEFNACGNCANN